MSPTLPDLFARWYDDVVGEALPAETKADCGSCAMCGTAPWLKQVPELAFDPSSRCCTYRPELMNFQVGAILSQPDTVHPHGLATIRERIGEAESALPVGLTMGPDYRARYVAAVKTNRFGRDPSLLCPHFVSEGQLCGIWRHRNAICTTWYCRHERGVVGKGLWVAVRRFLTSLQRALSAYAMEQLLMDGDALTWGSWEGRREAFYKACWEQVRDLRWETFQEGAPDKLHESLFLLRRILAAYQRSGLPERPVLHHADIVTRDEEGAWVAGYVSHDPLHMSEATFESLKAFDGRPWREVLEDLAARGTPLSEEDFRVLLDFDVLR
jgi:hypothetical protein